LRKAPTGLAYVLNYRLIQDEGATAAATASYLVPVIAVMLGVLIQHEAVTWNSSWARRLCSPASQFPRAGSAGGWVIGPLTSAT
jgi:hypothetical protein